MQSEDTTRNHIDSSQQKMQPSSSRILYDIPCKVCRDHSSGKHYGIFACDGCAGFFKRSIRRNRQYVCKAKSEHGCMVDKTHRNQCRSCRLAKCIQAGMNKDAVQHERGPRNSTLRRQMGYLFKTPDIMMSSVQHQHLHQHQSSTGAVLDLALPKSSSQTRLTVAQTATQSTIQSSSSSSPPRTRAPPPPPPQPQPPHSVYCNSITMNKIPINLSNNLTTIPTLPILTPTMSADSVKETAARLLFMNVSWTRDLVTSAGLTIEDQLTLIEASWRELFLLGAAQMVPTLDPSALVPPSNENIPLILQVNRFRETLAGFNSMNLDYHEYACIKAIVLFKAGLDCEIVPSSRSSSGSASPNSICKLRDPAAVARLHYGAQIALGQRLNGATFGELRFGKLLMLLPTLRSVSPHAIEELFFRSTIGGIHIEKIICDMYKNTSNK